MMQGRRRRRGRRKKRVGRPARRVGRRSGAGQKIFMRVGLGKHATFVVCLIVSKGRLDRSGKGSDCPYQTLNHVYRCTLPFCFECVLSWWREPLTHMRARSLSLFLSFLSMAQRPHPTHLRARAALSLVLSRSPSLALALFSPHLQCLHVHTTNRLFLSFFLSLTCSASARESNASRAVEWRASSLMSVIDSRRVARIAARSRSSSHPSTSSASPCENAAFNGSTDASLVARCICEEVDEEADDEEEKDEE